MIELKPLARDGFNATYPRSINDYGHVVGDSYVYSDPILPAPQPGPYSTATIWFDGAPSALTSSPNTSQAYAINNRGEVLFWLYDNPNLRGKPKPMLWKQGNAVDLT